MSEMFDKDFYPTPDAIIEKMCEGLSFYNKTVLEPSAGKGDIVKKLLKLGAKKVVAIERNAELGAILKEITPPEGSNTRYLPRVADYLTVAPRADIIIANPPFSCGAKHLLKMLECKGADIRCLLNAETINNKCNSERVLLGDMLGSLGADILQLGQCFSTAERQTGVSVVLVKVSTKNGEEIPDFEPVFDQETYVNEDFEHTSKGALASNNKIESIVKAFDTAKLTMAEVMRVKNKLKYYEGMIGYTNYGFYPATEKVYRTDDDIIYKDYCNTLRESAWKKVFQVIGLEKYLTTKVQDKFDKLKESQDKLAFTVKNVALLAGALIQNGSVYMQDSIEEAFDTLTSYHKENRICVKGWKTNERWKVGRRFILPNICDKSLGEGYYHSNNVSKMDDLDKVLCYITGLEYIYTIPSTKLPKSDSRDIAVIGNNTHVSVRSAINSFNPHKSGAWFESTFFRIRLYKKGTGHFEFKDAKLWDEFNLRATRGKNWLGN